VDRRFRFAPILAGAALLTAAASAEPGRSHPGDGAVARSLGAEALLPARRVPLPPPTLTPNPATTPAEPPADLRYGVLRRDAAGALTELPPSAAVLALLDAPRPRGLAMARSGADAAGRRQVTAAEGFPARAMGMVYAVHGDTAFGCSGALIGPATVLTAAACVHHAERGWPDAVLFVPAMLAGDPAPYGVWPWAGAAVPPAHLAAPDSGAPAVVTLAAPVGESLGWLGFAAAAEGAETVATLYGYPADAPAGSLWQAACLITPPAAETPFAHGCAGFAGIAGGAIHAYHPADDQRRVLGLSLPAAADAPGRAVALSPARVQWLAELWR
jgi:V8-like Glu-specific endopeptidase